MQASMHAGKHAAAAPREGAPPRRLSTYVATWVLLATSGLAYLAVVAARPDLVSGGGGEQVAAAATAHSVDLTEQLTSTKGWLRDLENELGETRRQLSAERERTTQLSQRLAFADDIKSQPLPEPEKQQTVILPPVVSLEPGAGQITPPTAGFRIVNAAPVPKQSGIVTGTVEAGKAAPAEPAPVPANTRSDLVRGGEGGRGGAGHAERHRDRGCGKPRQPASELVGAVERQYRRTAAAFGALPHLGGRQQGQALHPARRPVSDPGRSAAGLYGAQVAGGELPGG